MKKLFLGFLFIGLITTVFAQNSAILISLNGIGSVKHATSTESLQVPMTFKNGDIITLESGSAQIMYFTGEEVAIQKGKTYTVTSTNTTIAESPLLTMTESGTSNNLLAQSGSVYNIRGIKHIFPTKSKLQSITDSICLVFKFEDTTNLNLVLQIKESKMQKVVYENKVNDTLVKLPSNFLEAGKTYYWTVTGTPRNMPELGTIVVQAPSPISLLPQSKTEYINAICSQYEKGMYFSALALCIEAKEKFPNTTIFHVMYENILQ